MDIKVYHQNRILAYYLSMKLSDKIDNLNIEELNEFLGDKDCHFEDLENMIQKIESWRFKKNKNQELISDMRMPRKRKEVLESVF
jgi:benzoyl-CoA reductase/2-hydroxyglutaryl-CoA dehydratase subunit BcrC/BadD/HgdB